MTRLGLLCSLLTVLGCGGTADLQVCGDGILDPVDETCDDGNNVAGDGCFQCEIEGGCGNGVINANEACDDGNLVGGDGCSAMCTDEVCGNAVVDVGEVCDDGNLTDGDACSADCHTIPTHVTTANWSLKDLASNMVTGCPAGFDTAEVVSQRVDANGAPIGAAFVDLFNCADLTGAISPLPSGLYETHIDITNGSATYAQSLSAIVDLTTLDRTLTVEILNDGGYFALAWTLRDATTNSPLTCAQVTGLDSIEIISTVSGMTATVADRFTCADGGGVTGGLLAGSYTISVAALNTQEQALGAPQNQANKSILAPNQVTDLGTIDLPID